MIFNLKMNDIAHEGLLLKSRLYSYGQQKSTNFFRVLFSLEMLK